MSYLNNYYRSLLKYTNEKSDSFIYELALKRGKDRGWYPKEWTVDEYTQHLFRKVDA